LRNRVSERENRRNTNSIKPETRFLFSADTASQNPQVRYNSYRAKHLNRESMSIYIEVLSQAQSLTPDEQERLLEELASLMRQRRTSSAKSHLENLQSKSVDRWFGFLSTRVDALEFERQLRQEWDE
jgi:hypothetical protein